MANGTLNVTVPRSSPLLITPKTSLELILGVDGIRPLIPGSVCMKNPGPVPGVALTILI